MRELMMKMTTGLLDIRQRPPLLGRDCSNCPRSYEEILSAFCNINDRSGLPYIKKLPYKSHHCKLHHFAKLQSGSISKATQAKLMECI